MLKRLYYRAYLDLIQGLYIRDMISAQTVAPRLVGAFIQIQLLRPGNRA